MKHIITATAAALVALVAPSTAYAADEEGWTFINEDKGRTRVYARTEDLLRGRSDQTVARMWVKFDASRDPTVSWRVAVTMYVINCPAQTYRAVQNIYYYRDGTNNSNSNMEAMQFITPDTVLEAATKMLCSDPETPVSSALPTLPPSDFW